MFEISQSIFNHSKRCGIMSTCCCFHTKLTILATSQISYYSANYHSSSFTVTRRSLRHRHETRLFNTALAYCSNRLCLYVIAVISSAGITNATYVKQELEISLRKLVQLHSIPASSFCARNSKPVDSLGRHSSKTSKNGRYKIK